MEEFGVCALTGEECDLRESHIYPKFMFETMKKLGGTNFRISNIPNKVLQDGLKRRLLGHNAEQKFSKSEKWFAETIFRPYCFDMSLLSKPITYDENLYYFIPTNLRFGPTLKLDIDDYNSFAFSIDFNKLLVPTPPVYLKDTVNIDGRFKNDLIEAEKEWKCYLLNKKIPEHYDKLYLLPLGNNSISSNYLLMEGQEYYNLRTFDAALAFDDTGAKSAFYCKCPRFAFWGVLSDQYDENINYGLRIKPEGGKFSLKKWRLGEWYIIGFLYGRVNEANKQFLEGQSLLSLNQENQILKNIRRKNGFDSSELADLLIKDYINN